VDVHRVVLCWRSWALLDFTGQEQAHTLLRQSVRYCVRSEQNRNRAKNPPSEVRTLLPKLLDQYKLVGKEPGKRPADDGWVEALSKTISTVNGAKAADAVAAALAEGFAPEAVGEAIALAANHLVLCDKGRQQAENGKPIGSCHGDSQGVHASDSVNAWRNIARVSNQRNAVASLILAGYHAARERYNTGQTPYPLAEQLEKIQITDPAELLRETEAAIRAKDQARACALVHRYGALGQSAKPVFDLLLRYGVSEDGALHAEKYYHTVVEEFAALRPAFRWRELVALARVTASEYGFPAPGYEDARRLLKLS
jgi:hypothetical protein